METLIARSRAEATVTVQSHESRPFAEGEGPTLVELGIVEAFAGEIEGESNVRALQVAYPDGSARLLSLQRVRGALGGRAGSFVLQGEGTVEEGRVKSSWSVVRGSGTGELSGLRGEGGFEGEFGKGSRATLDYWFE